MGRRTVRRVHRTLSKKDRVQKQATTSASAEHPLSDLQKSIGSQAVQRLISSPYIQTKLEVSSPQDKEENEADLAAQQVMRSAEGGGAGSTLSGRGSAHSGPHELSSLAAEPGLEKGLAGSASASPLSDDVREFMEPRLGADLSGVKVHTGEDAAQMSDQLQAQAFTHGQDVYFAAGMGPGKDALTAHELAHVVQQTGSARPSLSPNLISRSPDEEKKPEQKKSDPTYWFQNKPPEKPVKTEHGILITPKGQVFVDPNVRKYETSIGILQLQFAGMDTDFEGGKPTPAFANAEKAVAAAITDAVAELRALPEIKGPQPLSEKLEKRKQDETVRARLKEAARTLSGKTLNIFIATDLSVAEKLSQTGFGFQTEQIFVRPGDIGDPTKLQAAIRVPLIALTGGVKGFAPGPGGLEQTSVQALTEEQLKESLLHEMVHVMLINRGASAVQVWKSVSAGMVSGPDDIKSLAEDVLFRYVRAQEEIFVYSAIGEVYSAFKANKDRYDFLVGVVEAFLKSVGVKVDLEKSFKIDVKEKIGPKQKEAVTWSITYKLPKALKVDKTHLEILKQIQKVDIGS